MTKEQQETLKLELNIQEANQILAALNIFARSQDDTLQASAALYPVRNKIVESARQLQAEVNTENNDKVLENGNSDS